MKRLKLRLQLTPEEFEKRVESVPDLELSWTYWNWMLPETTGLALYQLFLWPALRSLTAKED